MLSRLLSAPLFHFLLAGGLGVLLVTAWTGDSGAPAEGNRVRVDAEALEQFVWTRTGLVDEAAFEERYAGLSPAARRDWIDRFVREEVLVREARRLGLDREDELIRRRLVQKLEFLALGALEGSGDPSSEELEAHYREHREDYRIPVRLSFTHVFLRVPGGGDTADEGRLEQARALRKRLDAEGVGASQALGRGDRFLYGRSYRDRTLDEIESHFGAELARALTRLEPEPEHWQGPLASDHGLHLVLLDRVTPSRLPQASEIRAELREDWLRRRRERALDEAVGEIVSRYEIEVDPAVAR